MLFVFKKEYKPLIVSGRKTQTVRMWKRCWLKEGQIVKSPGLGMLRIDQVARLKLSELTQKDARLDGFATKKQMLEALRKIYNLKNIEGVSCYRVRFKYLGRAEPDTPPDGAPLAAQRDAVSAARSAGPVRRKKKQKPPADGKDAKRKQKEFSGKTKPAKQENLFPPF